MSQYNDIIHLPHHVSEKRVSMSLIDRAAQFSPFAALTGYDAVIAETGRLTQRSVELDEGTIAQLNQQLHKILAVIHTQPTVTAVYFLPDPRKDGGSYQSKTGAVKMIDTHARILRFTDRTEVYFEQLTALHLHNESDT